MLANGKQAFPVCTLMDLENRLFHGRMGPKISDVSQIFVADVHPKWVERVVKPMSKWVVETGYIGWFDVDLAYDVATDTYFCFEFMVRFSIPSISLAFKLGSCNWLVGQTAVYFCPVLFTILPLGLAAARVKGWQRLSGRLSMEASLGCRSWPV